MMKPDAHGLTARGISGETPKKTRKVVEFGETEIWKVIVKTLPKCKPQRADTRVGIVYKPIVTPWPDLGYTTVHARQRAVQLAHEVYPDMPLSALFAKTARTRRWVGDTGASFHLSASKDITRGEMKSKRATERNIDLITANGVITIDTEVDVEPKFLRGTIQTKLLEDAPPAISIGIMCEEDEYSFW